MRAGAPQGADDRRRFPQVVYGVGKDPDPRFSLANERTFLAWVRTALALMAAGVALEALRLPAHPQLRLGVALTCVALAMGGAIQAWVGWVRAERALRLGRGLPSPTLGLPLAVGVLLVGVALSVGFLG